MEIKKVTDPEFRAYGQVVDGYDCKELLAAMEQTPLPEDVVYVASVKELEDLPVAKMMETNLFGQMPIQVGYCNGHNKKLNALEYHRNSEVNVAATDLVLLLGKQQDIKEDHTYDTSLVEAFLVPKGTVIEVYATTLHYAPCSAKESGFRCVIVLPKDTNLELDFTSAAEGEDKLITAKNKWLIAHPDTDEAKQGAVIGITGENVDISELI